jgi:hypothetical protein
MAASMRCSGDRSRAESPCAILRQTLFWLFLKHRAMRRYEPTDSGKSENQDAQ